MKFKLKYSGNINRSLVNKEITFIEYILMKTIRRFVLLYKTFIVYSYVNKRELQCVKHTIIRVFSDPYLPDLYFYFEWLVRPLESCH